MAHLSIRKLPPGLDKAIQHEAKKLRTTKTQVVIHALEGAFHLKKSPKRVHRDIRSFFGKMTQHDYQEFQKLTRDFSVIDEEMWK